MFDDFNMLDKYPSFTMKNGMILHEMMQQKSIGFNEVFSVLGPKSVVMEIINGKRFLKNSQIKQLAELFGINQDIFELESRKFENSELGIEENVNSDSNSFSNMDNSIENNQENLESHSTMNEEEFSEKNQFGDFQNHEMKQYWDD